VLINDYLCCAGVASKIALATHHPQNIFHDAMNTKQAGMVSDASAVLAATDLI